MLLFILRILFITAYTSLKHSDLFSAYNGSLISSLTSPTLSKPLDTFRELLNNAKDLDIMTQKNTGNFFIQTV